MMDGFSNFAFQFKLRRYSKEGIGRCPFAKLIDLNTLPSFLGGQGLTLVHLSTHPEPFLPLNTSPERLNTPSTPASNTP